MGLVGLGERGHNNNIGRVVPYHRDSNASSHHDMRACAEDGSYTESYKNLTRNPTQNFIQNLIENLMQNPMQTLMQNLVKNLHGILHTISRRML